MKFNITQHKYTAPGLLCLVAAMLLNACIKNQAGGTEFNNLRPTVLIPEGGLSTFSTEALVFPGGDASDTAVFHVNYAATNVAPADETIGLAIDTAKIGAYDAANTIQYEAFPDSIYSFQTTSVTVKKGDNYTSAIPFVVYPSKVDPTKNYMLPITISTAPAGSTISANYGTIYYHLIGNPIAGTYEEYWSRWNAGDTTSGPSGALYYQDDLGTVTFAPNSPTEVEVVSGGVGEADIIDFTNTSGMLTNFSVSLTPVSGITEGGPSFVKADPVNGIYEIYFTYVNSSGATRAIVNKFVKQ